MQGWTFDDAFDLMRSTGRTAVPFRTGSHLVSTSCLPYREPDGIEEEDGCTLATPTCNSLQLTLQGGFAGLRTRGRAAAAPLEMTAAMACAAFHCSCCGAPTPRNSLLCLQVAVTSAWLSSAQCPCRELGRSALGHTQRGKRPNHAECKECSIVLILLRRTKMHMHSLRWTFASLRAGRCGDADAVVRGHGAVFQAQQDWGVQQVWLWRLWRSAPLVCWNCAWSPSPCAELRLVSITMRTCSAAFAAACRRATKILPNQRVEAHAVVLVMMALSALPDAATIHTCMRI
jgi:hypothetical protein